MSKATTKVYPEYDAFLKVGKEALTIEEAKATIGWTSEKDVLAAGGEAFGTNYDLKDMEGNKIRLLKNKGTVRGRMKSNRPLKYARYTRYKDRILHGFWKYNGESVVLDWFGVVQSGQHRLVGFILAEQERQLNVEYWKEYGHRGPIKIECLIAVGIDPSDEVTDTLDTGDPRKLADILCRNREFGDEVSDKVNQQLGNIYGFALRLVYLRTHGKTITSGGRLDSTTLLEFKEKHPGLKDSVLYVWEEEGGKGADGKRISTLVSLGNAAAFHYLMSASKTEPYGDVDLSMKPKADDFWTFLASGEGLTSGSPILALIKLLPQLNADTGQDRDMIAGAIVNAWNAFVDGETGVTAKKLKPSRKKEEDKWVVVDHPRIGGIDIAAEEEEVKEEEEAAPKKKTAKKKTAKRKKAAPKAAPKAAEAATEETAPKKKTVKKKKAAKKKKAVKKTSADKYLPTDDEGDE